ncbi:type II toxin-antitoxin system VapC family toxin [Micromonospora sp. LOL_023]|uniref:type II toxin-antitoxin system VapC family toxin n=1 Tax=Micromonospora sp. LOL_023 TaxID=3345418 RepID=UPI003A8634E1
MTARTPRPFVVVDTGPLVAMINKDDEHHTSCVKWLELALRERRTLVIPVLVITEVCYLLKRTAGSGHGAAFLDEVSRTPAYFRLFCPGRADFNRMGQLVRKYADLPLGATDAAVIAAAERFGTTEIATVDRRMAAAVKVADRYPVTVVP